MTYRFYCEFENGNELEVVGLTKRQAVLRYNKACLDYRMVRCGWEVME